MGRKKSEISVKLNEAKEKVENILATYGKLEEFHESKIYVMSGDKLKYFEQISESLDEKNTTSVRKKAYTLNQVVNLVNPNKTAFQYNYTKVLKYAFLTTKDTCIKEAQARVAVSANFYRKELDKEIAENPSWSEGFIEQRRNELEQKIKDEVERVDEVVKNPQLLKSIKICGFKHKKEHAQVNYGYIGTREVKRNGKKVTEHNAKIRTNAHLSKVYPNVLFYEEDENLDRHKSEMDAKYLEKNGYIEISRDIYVKYNDNYEGKK